MADGFPVCAEPGTAPVAVQSAIAMMKLRLGFFPQFKFVGSDAVLLDGAATEISLLAARLGEFAASSESELPIHDFAIVSLRHPVQLFASRTGRGAGAGFRWLCSAAEIATVQEKLEALSASAGGHQYFNLMGSPAQLIVSVSEYDESWWRQHGSPQPT